MLDPNQPSNVTNASEQLIWHVISQCFQNQRNSFVTCVKSKKERFNVFCVRIPKKHWWWKISGKITLFILGAHFLVPIWKFRPIQLWKWSIKRMVRRRQLSVNYVKKRREVCWNVFYVQRQFITDVWLKRMNMNCWINGWINVKNKTIFFISFA